MIEKTIKVATSDGTMPTYVFHPEGEGPHPAVIFYFDIFGIRDELKKHVPSFCSRGILHRPPLPILSHGQSVLQPRKIHERYSQSRKNRSPAPDEPQHQHDQCPGH